MSKACRKNSAIEAEVVTGIVQETVRYIRLRGQKMPHAIEDAALELGISPRRAKSFHYREVFRVARTEYLAILKRFVQHLDAEARETERLAQMMRERHLKFAQLSLDIGDTECLMPPGCASRNGGGVVPLNAAIGSDRRTGAGGRRSTDRVSGVA